MFFISEVLIGREGDTIGGSLTFTNALGLLISKLNGTCHALCGKYDAPHFLFPGLIASSSYVEAAKFTSNSYFTASDQGALRPVMQVISFLPCVFRSRISFRLIVSQHNPSRKGEWHAFCALACRNDAGKAKHQAIRRRNEFYYSGKPTPQVAWNTQKSLGHQPKLNVIKLIKIILLAINGHILCVKHHASSPAKNNNCSIKSYLKTKPRIKN